MSEYKVEFTKDEVECIRIAVDHYLKEGFTFGWISEGETIVKQAVEDESRPNILKKLNALYEEAKQ